MRILKGDVTKAVGCFQSCAGQEAGGEAAINAMNGIFKSNETQKMLLLDKPKRSPT